eukprot:sb/3469947/
MSCVIPTSHTSWSARDKVPTRQITIEPAALIEEESDYEDPAVTSFIIKKGSEFYGSANVHSLREKDRWCEAGLSQQNRTNSSEKLKQYRTNSNEKLKQQDQDRGKEINPSFSCFVQTWGAGKEGRTRQRFWSPSDDPARQSPPNSNPFLTLQQPHNSNPSHCPHRRPSLTPVLHSHPRPLGSMSRSKKPEINSEAPIIHHDYSPVMSIIDAYCFSA